MANDGEAEALLAELAALLPGAVPIGEARGPGAYALLIGLAEPARFARAALGEAMLGGWLVYAGSARGPGGIAARVGRHLRKGKTVRWHVDELTAAARTVRALALPGGSECAIVGALLASGRFEVAMAGFGSSDCRTCPGHLLTRTYRLPIFATNRLRER